jgi:ATP-dependent RNA helicase RhlE
LTSATFSSLGLGAALLRALDQLGHDEPTPVQTQAIPAILRGGDVWASAKTGSGKTAAFVLPLLQALADHERPGTALIVVPTRELAVQIAEAVRVYGRLLPRPPRTCVAVGGVSINPQMIALGAPTDIVVGTPGRLLDLCDERALRTSSVTTLVLDEADRLLKMGFADQINRLLTLLPARRQNLLFSATFPPVVRALANEVLRDPTRVNVDAGAMPDANAIHQRVIEVDEGRKSALLRHLLRTDAWPRLLVFVASKQTADILTAQLARAGVPTAALHGDLSQGARTDALADFKAGRLRVLVATDLAARGLDIVDLPAVINYDLPRSPVDYLHRIGRTGRAGKSGTAISFVTAASKAHFQLIEKRHHLQIAREQLPGFEPKILQAPPGDPHGGKKGKRKSKKDKLREAAARGQKA